MVPFSIQSHVRQRAAAPNCVLAASLRDNRQRGRRGARQAEVQQVQRPVVVARALLPPQQHLAAQLRHHRAAAVADKAWAVTTSRASTTALCCRGPRYELGRPCPSVSCRSVCDKFPPCIAESGKKELWLGNAGMTSHRIILKLAPQGPTVSWTANQLSVAVSDTCCYS